MMEVMCRVVLIWDLNEAVDRSQHALVWSCVEEA